MKILKDIGFTENEEKVYLCLLDNADVTGADVARLLNMDKTSVYRAIDTLVVKGIVKAHVKKRGSTYRVESPDTLLYYFKNKKAEFESKGKQLENFVSKLKKNVQSKRSAYIKVEQGLEAHIKRMEESLWSKEKLIRERFRDHVIFKEKRYVDYVKKYVDERVKQGIFIRQLEFDFERMYKEFGEIMSDFKKYKKEVRTLPKELDVNNSMRIWDDTINIMSYDEKQDFIVITIKDRFVAELMKNMYDFIWERSEEIN